MFRYETEPNSGGKGGRLIPEINMWWESWAGTNLKKKKFGNEEREKGALVFRKSGT